MNCSKAEKYMMKYMDGEMTEEEAKKLNIHLQQCDKCKCDFLAYEQIMADMEDVPTIFAPADFEHQVMAKVTQLTDTEFHVQYHVRSKIWGHMWGAFTVIFGTGTVIAYYKEPILQSLSHYPHFYNKLPQLTSIEQQISMQGHMVYTMGNQVSVALEQMVSNSMDIVVVLLAVLCGIQYYLLHRKSKADRMSRK
jgi:hypothetical protein